MQTHLTDLRYSYDGDENNNETKSSAPVAPEPSAPSKATSNLKEEPGYGEEPDTAVPPASFEDDSGNHEVEYEEDNGKYDYTEGDKYQNNAPAARDEPLQMKEDG